MGGGSPHILPPEAALLAVMAGAAAAALMFIAAAWDLARREIPNRASAGVALAALPSLLGQPLASSLATVAVAAVLFGLGIVAFRFALLGGGDVKLLGAVGLWIPPSELGLFLLVQAFVTLVIAGVMLFRARLGKGGRAGSSPQQSGHDLLPFGVPIAAGGLAVMVAEAGLLASGAT